MQTGLSYRPRCQHVMFEIKTLNRSMAECGRSVWIRVEETSMTNRLVLIAALGAAAGIAPAHAQAPAAADTILINGKVITLDDTSSIVQAVAIRYGKILAAGGNADIRTRADA